MMPEPMPMVIEAKMLELRVCVPKTWTDGQVEKYAQGRNPLVVWKVGTRPRKPCGIDPGAYHITLDCA